MNIKGVKYRTIKKKKADEEGNWASIDHENKIIYIERGMTKNDEMRTLIHELVHGLCRQLAFYQMPSWSMDIEELLAENVANTIVDNFLVTKRKK